MERKKRKDHNYLFVLKTYPNIVQIPVQDLRNDLTAQNFILLQAEILRLSFRYTKNQIQFPIRWRTFY